MERQVVKWFCIIYTTASVKSTVLMRLIADAPIEVQSTKGIVLTALSTWIETEWGASARRAVTNHIHSVLSFPITLLFWFKFSVYFSRIDFTWQDHEASSFGFVWVLLAITWLLEHFQFINHEIRKHLIGIPLLQ